MSSNRERNGVKGSKSRRDRFIMEEYDLSVLKIPSRPKLLEFEGISMVPYFMDNWENVQNFKARPDDILIATYPRSGTTWLSYMLHLLYFGETSIPIYLKVPVLESAFPAALTGVEETDKLSTTPRLIKTHLPVQLVPKSFWEQNCRVIYVARNAKDNAVSYFHYERMTIVQPEPGDWSTFLQNYMDGKKLFGPWYDHVCGYWEKKKTYSNIHYMFYEDMVEDTGREVDRLCSFLGLSTPAEEKEGITNSVHFNTMKQNNMINHRDLPIMDFKISEFLRKGKVGDWKNHFTVAQSEQFDKHYKQRMKNTTLMFRTEF